MTLKRDADCTRCPLHETAQHVCLLGEGPQPSEVAIIGEAPGEREDDEGKPFVGRAGKYLDEIMSEVGLSRKKIFITNAVSCRPPNNRTPKKREIKACNHWLMYQLRKVKPKFILLLGNTALEAITGEKGIKAARGKPFRRDGVLYLPTYHPSYVLRNDYKDDQIFRNDLALFKSLIEGGDLPTEKRLSIKLVESEQAFEAMLRDMRGDISFDIETSGLYPWAEENRAALPKKWKKDPPDPRSYTAEVKSIGFGTEKHQWVWLRELLDYTPERLRRVGDKMDECIVSGHYAKFDALWMKVQHGVDWHVDFDTGIAHYMLDENSPHGLKLLAQKMCGAPNWDVDKQTKQFGGANREQGIRYHAHDLFYTRELHQKFKRKLRNDPGVHRVFHHIMMPCNRAFVDMEFEGCYIDIARMGEVERELHKRINAAKKALERWVPVSKRGTFNWGSPKQVAWLLYQKLKIECPEKTKTGADSTGESALKQIDHPLVDELFKFREAKQNLSFFIDGWKPYLVGKRLHPSFKLTGTITGRLSSEHPNWQQVPRDPLIRTLLTAAPGWVLIEADLSQVELRIAAELSGDTKMLETFQRGADPHWDIAMAELERGGGGDSYETAIETAKLYLVSKGLPANGFSAKILQEVWRTAKAYPFGGSYLSLVLEKRKVSGARSREWWKPERVKKWLLERGLTYMAEEVSQESVRALWRLEEYLSSPQGRKQSKLGTIEFSDALQIVSQIGASEAVEIKSDWKELRKKAKAVAFGYLYGMWWKKFIIYARDKYGVKITAEQAQESRKSFFSNWRHLEGWHKRTKQFARRNGYVRYLSGRKRRLPDAMLDEDSFKRQEAERQAVNSPVQGMANEINLMALIQLKKEFSSKVYRPIATVHDSILAYARVEHAERIARRTMEVMRRPALMDKFDIDMRVPLEADVKLGAWGAGISLEKWLDANRVSKKKRAKV